MTNIATRPRHLAVVGERPESTPLVDLIRGLHLRPDWIIHAAFLRDGPGRSDWEGACSTLVVDHARTEVGAPDREVAGWARPRVADTARRARAHGAWRALRRAQVVLLADRSGHHLLKHVGPRRVTAGYNLTRFGKGHRAVDLVIAEPEAPPTNLPTVALPRLTDGAKARIAGMPSRRTSVRAEAGLTAEPLVVVETPEQCAALAKICAGTIQVRSLRDVDDSVVASSDVLVSVTHTDANHIDLALLGGAIVVGTASALGDRAAAATVLLASNPGHDELATICVSLLHDESPTRRSGRMWAAYRSWDVAVRDELLRVALEDLLAGTSRTEAV